MYDEVYLKNDHVQEKSRADVCIESVDTVASYSRDRQNLKFAVSVLNRCREPVYDSIVFLTINAPDGSRISLSQKTDAQGVALFELNDIGRGRWEAGVSKVCHPDYDLSLNHHSQRWSATDV